MKLKFKSHGDKKEWNILSFKNGGVKKVRAMTGLHAMGTQCKCIVWTSHELHFLGNKFISTRAWVFHCYAPPQPQFALKQHNFSNIQKNCRNIQKT